MRGPSAGRAYHWMAARQGRRKTDEQLHAFGMALAGCLAIPAILMGVFLLFVIVQIAYDLAFH